MLIVFAIWACLFNLSCMLRKAWFPLCVVELPVILVLFIVSKDAFTEWMLQSEWPRRDVIIDGKLYLRRFFLTPRHWRYKLFLHNIRIGDTNRDPHNHPWPFTTFT